MSRKGENIYKRKDGRWEGRYIKGYTVERKIKYGYVYAKTYKDVKKKLLEKNTLTLCLKPKIWNMKISTFPSLQTNG